jgi:hypothetical protein
MIGLDSSSSTQRCLYYKLKESLCCCVYTYATTHVYVCVCIFALYNNNMRCYCCLESHRERRAKSGRLYMPVKIIDFRSEESQSSTQHIHIQCLTIHSSSAPRRHHSTHTARAWEQHSSISRVTKHLSRRQSARRGGPACALSMYYVMLFSHIGKWTRKRLGALYRAHSTNRDRHRHKHIIHSAASAAVPFTHIKPTQRKFKGYIIRGDAICAVWGYNM